MAALHHPAGSASSRVIPDQWLAPTALNYLSFLDLSHTQLQGALQAKCCPAVSERHLPRAAQPLRSATLADGALPHNICSLLPGALSSPRPPAAPAWGILLYSRPWCPFPSYDMLMRRVAAHVAAAARGQQPSPHLRAVSRATECAACFECTLRGCRRANTALPWQETMMWRRRCCLCLRDEPFRQSRFFTALLPPPAGACAATP